MLFLIAFLFPLIFIYSLSYVKRNLFRYYFVLFIAFGGMVGTVLARDLLSFYIFLEIMTVGIYFLIIDNAKKESFPAGFKYILMMFGGGILILLSFLLLYNLTGTFEIAEIARVAGTLNKSALAPIFTLFAIGCLFEIGAVPFHIWLPDAHPVAPSPVSALLSGVAIKIGAYGIIRMIFTLGVLSPVLIFIGAVSMVFGVVLALKQTNVKRLLAYHSISQMGYVLLGIGVGTGLGIGGGLFHILNHAVFKALLFLCMGAVIYATGERELNKLGGLGKRMPVTLVTFGIAALAISGIPPLNGFASKAMIAQSVSGNVFLKLAIIITASGTVASFVKLFRFTFLGKLPDKLKNSKDVPVLMLFPLLFLAGICLVAGIFPDKVLGNLISPAVGSVLAFNFINVKILIDTVVIIIFGAVVYMLGLKTGYMKIEKGKSASSLPGRLSLDLIFCGAADMFTRGCVELRKLHARNLNVNLIWIFAALVIVLLIMYNPIK